MALLGPPKERYTVHPLRLSDDGKGCGTQKALSIEKFNHPPNIADSLNVPIQLERRPGKRFVSEVIEIRGYNSEAGRYDLFPICAAHS